MLDADFNVTALTNAWPWASANSVRRAARDRAVCELLDIVSGVDTNEQSKQTNRTTSIDWYNLRPHYLAPDAIDSLVKRCRAVTYTLRKAIGHSIQRATYEELMIAIATRVETDAERETIILAFAEVVRLDVRVILAVAAMMHKPADDAPAATPATIEPAIAEPAVAEHTGFDSETYETIARIVRDVLDASTKK